MSQDITAADHFCGACRADLTGRRSDAKFCTEACRRRARRRERVPATRSCRECGATFTIGMARGDANRQHCSKSCAKRHATKSVSTWKAENPEAWRGYTATRLAKNPGYWTEQKRAQRAAIIDLLGGQCVAGCDVVNPLWLHVDYVPGSRDLPFRHPRHLRFVRDHVAEFRLLCANHHYELTLTGAIAGTEITQGAK